MRGKRGRKNVSKIGSDEQESEIKMSEMAGD